MSQESKKINVEEWVKKSQQGDADAFAKIYDRFVTPIYRYLYYRVDQGIAEDLTEETFLKAWQHLNQYKKGKYPFSAWLFKIAHNLLVDHHRKNRATLELSDDVADDRSDSNPVLKVSIKIESLRLKKSMKKLPETYQQIIILKYINELDNKEIAVITGKSEGAIRLIQFRALSKLRELLGKEEKD